MIAATVSPYPSPRMHAVGDDEFATGRLPRQLQGQDRISIIPNGVEEFLPTAERAAVGQRRDRYSLAIARSDSAHGGRACARRRSGVAAVARRGGPYGDRKRLSADAMADSYAEAFPGAIGGRRRMAHPIR